MTTLTYSNPRSLHLRCFWQYPTTKEYSPDSGLIYFGARYYEPKVGRWITPDIFTWAPDDKRILENNRYEMLKAVGLILKLNPRIFYIRSIQNFLRNPDLKVLKETLLRSGAIEPKMLYRYIYCQNNPVNSTDPDGTYISHATAAIVCLVAAVIGVVNWIIHTLQKSGEQVELELAGPAEPRVEVPLPQRYVPPPR